MAKKVLVVLSGCGNWGEERTGPVEALDNTGYKASMDETYFDPPLGRTVTTEEMADKVKAIGKSGRFAKVRDLSSLAFAGDMEDRKSIIRNKHVTGHCLEYDSKDGTGFLSTDFNMAPPPYPLEYILRDATAPDGAGHGNFGRENSVIVDYPFITGRSTADSSTTGQRLIEVLEDGLRRYGW